METDSSWDAMSDAAPRMIFPGDQTMADRLRRVRADLEDLNNYYNISIAPRRFDALEKYYSDELNALSAVDFDGLNQHAKVDYLLLRNFLRQRQHQLKLQRESQLKFEVVIPFAPLIIALVEDRQDVEPIVAERVAGTLANIEAWAQRAKQAVEDGEMEDVSRTSGYQASKAIQELRDHLREWYNFYAPYDPDFHWWATTPYGDADEALAQYLAVVQTHLAGMNPGNSEQDEIVGEPIGREGLLVELEAEMIPYTPEELIDLANEQYAWCEKQMKQASEELGFGDDWKKALEHTKQQTVPPGQQTQLAKQLVDEGSAYVRQHDLVTVPPIADNTWRMFMMSTAQQRVSPFFLGGPSIIVSSPTLEMEHELKQMVRRGNSKHLSKATAFHELVPGHRLQLFVAARTNSHRPQLASTPFFIEGWAMYWELLFWDRGDFFVSPEDRIGTMFWRMHRCARIIFSLSFHLGEMTPQECIDLLVDWVGHERSTAEGEVRRSLEGSYPPLYQAAYMLGSLQLWKMREEAVDSGKMGEKEFHDAVLSTGGMPMELVRAYILDKELTADYETKWRFYDFDSTQWKASRQ